MKLKHTIGRKDKIDIPDLSIENINVKIDSGAYSCAIHCSEINELDINGKKSLEIVFLDESNYQFTGKKYQFDSYSKKKVRSSNGQTQERYMISLKLKIYNEIYLTNFTLTKRNGLKNPILLGRTLLNNNFTIDTSKVNLSFKNKNENSNSI